MKLLTLDLSTSCTGWSIWNLETKKLEDFGFFKPNKKGMSKLEYPEKQLAVMQDLASQIMGKLMDADGFAMDGSKNLVKMILIEEINASKNRLGQKTLDGLHWILMNRLKDDQDLKYIKRVKFIDSDGSDGWRSRLGLRLNEMDKKLNAERKKINKKKLRGTSDLPIINKKHLAARYVNGVLGTTFDVDSNPTDNDVVDAIGIGLAYFLTIK